jgi:hypothetical protein
MGSSESTYADSASEGGNYESSSSERTQAFEDAQDSFLPKDEPREYPGSPLSDHDRQNIDNATNPNYHPPTDNEVVDNAIAHLTK